MGRGFHIETYGCQMNKHDSDLMAGILVDNGYRPVECEQAELVLINTCSVREHAERRALGRICELKKLKSRSSKLVMGVCGCMAQRMGESLLSIAPHVDLVVGTDAYRRLPDLVEKARDGVVMDVSQDQDERYSGLRPHHSSFLTAWVAIMRGCNNFCSYCIVPHVRGGERSRPMEEIVQEIKTMVQSGVKEVTLLGQNVNSYRDNGANLAHLLRAVDKIDGLHRIRFTTSHPRDLSEELLQAMAELPTVCEHLHLPVQSGSTRILASMNRGYTAKEYRSRVIEARGRIPGLSVTTDIIAGFPGETEDDFRQTIHLMEEVAFDSSFTFRYSPRPGTTSARQRDDVPSAVKARRLEQLIALQRDITHRKNQELIGSVHEVLVEKRGKKKDQVMGRTRTDKPVVFRGDADLIGKLVSVKIVDARGWTLLGEVMPE